MAVKFRSQMKIAMNTLNYTRNIRSKIVSNHNLRPLLKAFFRFATVIHFGSSFLFYPLFVSYFVSELECDVNTLSYISSLSLLFQLFQPEELSLCVSGDNNANLHEQFYELEKGTRVCEASIYSNLIQNAYLNIMTQTTAPPHSLIRLLGMLCSISHLIFFTFFTQ
jgi:hypothetical protein